MPKTSIRVAMYTPYTGPTEVTDSDENRRAEFKRLNDAIGSEEGREKVSWLSTKLMQAETRMGRALPDNTLKLFMAPEWFFRKRMTPYTEDERDEILDELMVLSRMRQDWLLLPGSIIWGFPPDRRHPRWRVFNCAPVYYDAKLLLLLYKKNDADLYKPGRHGGLVTRGITETQVWGMYKKVDDRDNRTFDTEKLSKYVRPGTFTCEDISFGLEICRDHSDGVLRNSVRGQVDVHLYISCSCGINKPANLARAGGYLMQCEGNNENINLNRQVSSRIYRIAPGWREEAPLHVADPDCRTITGAQLHELLVIYDALALPERT